MQLILNLMFRLIENVFIKGKVSTNTYDTACREKSGQWAMIK